MAHSLIAQAGENLLVRTISVTLVVMAFFGVATGALPVRCWIGGICATGSEATSLEVAPASPSAQPKAPSAEPARPVEVAAVEPQTVARRAPTLTHNDVIASTFAQLKVEFQAPTALPTTPMRVATAKPFAAPAPLKPRAETTITNPDSGLTKRVVSTVSINPDGTPDLPGNVAEAYAPTPPQPATPPSPALEAAARIGAGQTPVAEVTPAVDLKPSVEPPQPKKPAAPRSGSASKSPVATVLGQGANVRANPSKSGKVLFAINGGEKVTVLDNEHGWTRIKDDRGRVGWIYTDGLRRA